MYESLKKIRKKKIKRTYSVKISQMRCSEIATKNEKLRFALFVNEINRVQVCDFACN